MAEITDVEPLTVLTADKVNRIIQETTRLQNAVFGDLDNTVSPTVKARRTTDLDIPNEDDTTIEFDEVEDDEDPDDMWDAAEPDIITINTPGLWLLVAQLRYPSNGDGTRDAKIVLNSEDVGADSIAANAVPGIAAGAGNFYQITASRRFETGDQLRLITWQSSGVTLTMPTDFGGVYLSATFLGP